MINYDDKINKNVLDLPKSGIRKFFDIANTLDDCISLGVGEPDFVTPWEIRNSAIKAMQAGRTQYTSNAGLLSLRQEIARYLDVRYSLQYNPDSEIIVTIGASEAIDLSMRTLVSAGDEVLIPSPSYVSYEPTVILSGGVPKILKTSETNQFKLTAKILEDAITPKTKVLILPYPNNPTGAIMTREELCEIVPVIVKHDLMVISDEIYAELTYGDVRHTSVCEIDGMKERTILISGFSKSFAMTGWRLGYLCAPYQITQQIYKIHQYTIMCAPTFSQIAGETALREGLHDGFAIVEGMKKEYDSRRKYLFRQFNDMGLSCFEPKGAFYVFPCVKSTGLSGEEFAERLLKEKHVAVVPGSAFGESGKDFIRCSYATSFTDLKTAVRKIREFLSSLK